MIILAAGLALVGYGAYKMFGPAGMPEVVMASGRRIDGEQVAGPVQARLLASAGGRVIHFGILLTDARGQTIRSINLPGLRRPSPEVIVVDQRGAIVHRGRFKYG